MSSQADNNRFNKANQATIWASIFVNELSRCGLKSVCIAPGSRSTPLALAFHAHPNIEVFVHLDERSAAFFALGSALHQGKAVAVLSTSGTAGANFFPAVIEAKMSNVPLLILTADRPPELRHSGANQTIDQVKLFGDQVLWSVDLGTPEMTEDGLAERNLRTLAARALFTAEGIVSGPVHLNFPFRKPLEPENVDDWEIIKSFQEADKPNTQMIRGIIQPSQEQLNLVSNLLNNFPQGIIICGPRCPGGDFPEAVTSLSQITGYPIFADPLSGIRFRSNNGGSAVIGGYETYLAGNGEKWPHPKVILRFGQEPTSKWLHEFFHNSAGAEHIQIRENGIWADGDHMTTFYIQASPTSICRSLLEKITRPVDKKWIDFWSTTDAKMFNRMEKNLDNHFFDGAIVSKTLDHLPNPCIVFSGNSLPIRHLDQYCAPSSKNISLYSNRGASGIDGNISTALGIAAQTNDPVVLLIGDVTFYHDSNGLLAIKKYNLNNVTIILLNNNGGGIFRRLPISKYKNEFGDLFETPHNLQFEPFANLYGLDFFQTKDLPSFKNILQKSINSGKPTLIEVPTNSENDELIRKQMIFNIQSKLSGKLE